jgi:Rieske Fe-S protein
MAGARRVGEGKLNSRRAFLSHALMLVAVAVRGSRVRLSAQLRYARLTRPVVIPLDDLAVPGRARPFTADAVSLPSAADPNKPLRLSGMVARISAGDDKPERFRAVCALCPHEHCDVDFVGDPSKLPEEVITEVGHPVKEPVYVCPCHNSTFKIDDGERLAGPAPRGLYQFRITSVTATTVEIGEAEEDLLLFTEL